MKIIKLATDFSEYPAGRYTTDGDDSGERFREDFLVPALKNGEVIVDLDGAMGYGSSFLEEAFGGVLRTHKDTFSIKSLRDKLHLISIEDPSLITEIWEYIEDQKNN